MRSGIVKISNPSSRATPIRVMPASSAMRIASAVGAETATITRAPMIATFCTSSIETRLVSSTMPLDGATPRQGFWHCTLPLLRPTSVFVLLVSLVAAVAGSLAFDRVYVKTKGGPANSNQMKII